MKYLWICLWIGSVVAASPVKDTVWSTYVSWGPLCGMWTGSAHPDAVALNATGDPVSDFKTEIEAAKNAGIDGFLFDLTLPRGRTTFYRYYVLDAMLEAAQGTGFYINPMFDATSPDAVAEAAALTEFHRRYAAHPNIRKNGNKVLIFGYHMNRNSPEYWKQVFDICRRNGVEFEAYFEFRTNNIAPDLDAVAAEMEKFIRMPEFAGIYHFYEIVGFEKYLPLLKKNARSHGKLFGGNLQVGYCGDLRSWRSDWYWPFFHTGVLRNSGDADLREKPDFMHVCTWNDYQETEIRPTLWQQDCESRMIRSYIDEWRGTSTKAETTRPELIFSARREILAGEILKLELVNLPSAAGQFKVRSALYDAATGKLLAEGAEKTVNGAARQVEAWRFDSAAWQSDPYPAAVRPEITLCSAEGAETFPLTSVLLRHGRLENTITAMTALSNIPEKSDFTLKIPASSDRELECELEFRSPQKLRSLQLMFDGVIFHSVAATDFNGQKRIALRVEPRSGFPAGGGLKIQLENGSIGRVSRRFNHFNNSFPRYEKSIPSELQIKLLAEGAVSLEAIGKDDTVIRAEAAGFHGSRTLGELKGAGTTWELKNDQGQVGLVLINTGSDVFPAIRPQLNMREGKLRTTIQTPAPIRSNSQLDAILVYENGTTEIKGPFWVRESTQTRQIPLFGSGEEFDEAYRHFSYNRPENPAAIRSVAVPHHALQYDCFDFGDDALCRNDGRYENGGTSAFPAVPGGTAWREIIPENAPARMTEKNGSFLRFDGKGDYLICGVRNVFSGANSVEMKIRPAEIGGRRQILFSNGRERGGYRNLSIFIDAEGYLVAERENPIGLRPETERNFWRQSHFETVRVKSKIPLSPEKWTVLRTVYEFDRLILFLDGVEQGSIAATPCLIRGNSAVRIGAAPGPMNEINSRSPGSESFHGDIAYFKY